MTVSNDTNSVSIPPGVSTGATFRVSAPPSVSQTSPDFSMSAATSIGVISNTRASSQVVTDFEGLYRTAQNNELCRGGLRRIENLISRSSTNKFSQVTNTTAAPANWIWTVGSATVSSATFGSFSDGVLYAEWTITNGSAGTVTPNIRFTTTQADLPAVAGQKVAFRARMAITAASGGASSTFTTACYTSADALVSEQDTVMTAANGTFADKIWATLTPNTLAGATTARLFTTIKLTVPVGASITIRIANVQAQYVCGASNQVCGKYVDAMTVYNAVVTGVRYSTYTNTNTVGAANTLTDRDGLTISNSWTGIDLPFGTGTNRKTYSEALDTAVEWTATQLGVTNNGTLGPDAIGQLQKLTDTAVAAEHTLYGAITGATTGTLWTVSYHVKAGDLYGVRLRVGTATDFGMAEFRFSDMTVVGALISGGTGTCRNAWIERVGLTDIYRVHVSATFSAAILGQATLLACSAAGVTIYTGTGKFFYAGYTDYTQLDANGPYIPNKGTGTSARALNVLSGTIPGISGGNNLTVVMRFRPYYNPVATWKQDWYEGLYVGTVGSADFLRVGTGNKTAANIYATKKAAGVETHAFVSATGLTRLSTIINIGRLTNNVLSSAINGGAFVTDASTVASNHSAVWSVGDMHAQVTSIEVWRRAWSDAEWAAGSLT